MIEVIPAIITHSYEDLEQKLKQVELYTNKVQLDVMDGNFVSDTTIGIEELEKIKTNLKFQIHLMVSKPEDIVGLWATNPKVSEIIFHIEATDKTNEVIAAIKKESKKVGIAINPETLPDKLNDFISQIDFVQFMTVHPGKYGSEFVEMALEHMSHFHNSYPDVKIIVDGAMHLGTIQRVVKAGASSVVIGGHIFSEGRNIGEAIQEIKDLIQ